MSYEKPRDEDEFVLIDQETAEGLRDSLKEILEITKDADQKAVFDFFSEVTDARKGAEGRKASDESAEAEPEDEGETDECDDRASSLQVIQDIARGKITPRSIDRETRRECVDLLKDEGRSDTEIAQFLHRSDKTIYRDRKLTQKKYAVAASPEVRRQLLGLLIRETEGAVCRIRRYLQSPQVSSKTRILGEVWCVKLLNMLVKTVDGVGCNSIG